MNTDAVRSELKKASKILQHSVTALENLGEEGKAALLIGVNYPGTQSALKGCVNDVHAVKDMLQKVYGFPEENIRCLTDDAAPSGVNPTRANIVEGLKWLVAKNTEEGCTSLWFHYSGHGSQTSDVSGDERDGRDECIISSDFLPISDDVLLRTLVTPLTAAARLVAVMDCCHSGTQLDLKYRYVSGRHSVHENRSAPSVAAFAVHLSGCQDSQTSADTKYSTGWSGALTKNLLEVLHQSDYNVACYTLLRKLRAVLRRHRFTQVPQFTSTRRITGSTIFSSASSDAGHAYAKTLV